MTDLSIAIRAIDAYCKRQDVYFAPRVLCSTDFFAAVAGEVRRSMPEGEMERIQAETPFPGLHLCGAQISVDDREWTGPVEEQFELVP